MKVLFSTAYWPNLHYFTYLLNADEILIEKFENYNKQSYRNRTQILSANGVLELSIPVKKDSPKIKINELQISYSENWQAKHWRALYSAYSNSPYFSFFEDEIKAFYNRKHELLLQYNLEQIEFVLKLLKIKRKIKLTENYEKDPGCIDLREKIHPKINFAEDGLTLEVLKKPYYQTFEEKFEFSPNLSILDLVFNKGLETVSHLQLPA